MKIDGGLIVCVRWIGAGNAFLGGLAAGLYFAQGDVFEGKETILVHRSPVDNMLLLFFPSCAVRNRISIVYHRTRRSACPVSYVRRRRALERR